MRQYGCLASGSSGPGSGQGWSSRPGHTRSALSTTPWDDSTRDGLGPRNSPTRLIDRIVTRATHQHHTEPEEATPNLR